MHTYKQTHTGGIENWKEFSEWLVYVYVVGAGL